tara:strand:+ start:335 stop:1327 length:993 start_codon:yes stop_codon:yes gene_type:complete
VDQLKKQRKSKFSKKNILIFSSLLLISIIVYSLWIFNNYSKSVDKLNLDIKDQQSKLALAKDEINNQGFQIEVHNLEKIKNDSRRKEYQRLLEEYDLQNEELEQQDSLILSLTIEVESLLENKKDLKVAQAKIINLQQISQKYIQEVYSLLLINKKLEFQLDSVNERIDSIEKDSKITIVNLEDSLNQARERLEKGSFLYINDIKVNKFKYGYGNTEKVTKRAEKTDLLVTSFEISENLTAIAEKKSVYIQYILPNNELLVYKDTTNIPFFIMGVDSIVYATTKVDFDYYNKSIILESEWEREDILMKGDYFIRFYIDGKFAGESTFRLN